MIFNGKELADKILEKIKNETSFWSRKPAVAVVSFGNKNTNLSYINQKKKAAGVLNFGFSHYHYSDNDSFKAREYLNKIAKMEKYSSVVVQLPLPAQINYSILNVIPPIKDPDLLSDKAVGMFFNNRGLVDPPTPRAILKILETEGVALKNKRVAVFGYGRLIGRFLVPMLIKKDALVSVVEKNTPRNLVLDISSKADIIISASGSPRSITGEMIKEGAVVVDAGFSIVDPVRGREGSQRPPASNGIDGIITGDVEFETVSQKTQIITPVPGGVGPVAVAQLFSNAAKLFRTYNVL